MQVRRILKLTLGPKGLIFYDPVSHNYLNRHLRSPPPPPTGRDASLLKGLLPAAFYWVIHLPSS